MKTILNRLFIVLGLALTLTACHEKEQVKISLALVQTANGITSDTLKGTIKGTLLSGKTYYFASDITVNDGDTLLRSSTAKLYQCVFRMVGWHYLYTCYSEPYKSKPKRR